MVGDITTLSLDEIADPEFVSVPQGNFKEEFYNDSELWESDIFAENPRKRTRKIALTPQRKEMTNHYFKIGQFGMGWYEGMLNDLVSIFGNEQDALLYIAMLSATSPNNGVEPNTYYAMKGYAFCKLGKRIPIYNKHKKRVLFKGFSESHYNNVKRACRGEELSGPKVSAFLLAMLGDVRAVVIDRWLIRALGFKSQKNSNSASVKLDNDCKITGFIKPFRQGYIVRVKEDSNIFCADNKDIGLLDFMASVEARKIKQRSMNEFYIPSFRVKGTPKWPDRSLSEAQYARFAEAVTRLADEAGVNPRDYQAAVWTGIKIEQDPAGLENFVFFYRKHYGDDPPNLDMLERIVQAPAFHPRFTEPTLFENPPESGEEWVLEQTASMLQ